MAHRIAERLRRGKSIAKGQLVMVEWMQALEYGAPIIGAAVAGSAAWVRSIERRIADTRTDVKLMQQTVEGIHTELLEISRKQDTSNEQLQRVIGFLSK